MNAPPATTAVFLSYASQDGEAARRLAEALRAAGVEVWFDQNELVGGDAWDAKIRGQIGACALFIPVISTATQARREGYFRLEWKLAAQRTHAMAEGTPFLLPVAIDPTHEAEALVPAEFKAVQWTRLPGGLPSALVARVGALLSPLGATREQAGNARGGAPDGAVDAKAASVAVLAFANLSSDPENEYFSDGISEELLNVLAKIDGLKVAARTSAFYFKGRNVPVPEIAQKLGVAYVVEGSVRKAGNQVRITAQLILAADGFHVWSENFNRRLDDIFAVQDEIAGLIVRAIRPVLAGKGDEAEAAARVAAEVRTANRGRTTDPEAYRLFLEGKFQFNQGGPGGWERAIDLFDQAVRRDPGFALGWAQLAIARSWTLNKDAVYKEIMPLIRAAAERAIALEPALPEGWAALGEAALKEWSWPEALRASRLALELAPRNASVLQLAAYLAIITGDLDRAIEMSRRALDADPHLVGAHLTLSMSLGFRGRYRESDAAARRMAEVAPASTPPNFLLWCNAMLEARWSDAEGFAARATSHEFKIWYEAILLFRRGRETEAARKIEQVEGSMPNYRLYDVVGLYAMTGRTDAAFAVLEQAYDEHHGMLNLVKSDVFLKSLHADPRWPAFIQKMGLDDDQLK